MKKQTPYGVNMMLGRPLNWNPSWIEGKREDVLESLPEVKDRFGNRMYPEQQYGGGAQGNRFYPDVSGVAGGYFMTNADLARELGHNPDVFARSGGFIGRSGPFARASRMIDIGKGGTAASPQPPGKADYVAETPKASDPAKLAMEKIVEGVEKSMEAQKSLLARYRPRNLVREKNVFA